MPQAINYRNPVIHEHQINSNWKNIDSSCPFSPKYLFILIITVIALMLNNSVEAESIILEWEPVVGDSRVSGYEVHYGVDSNQYQWIIEANANGSATDSVIVENLVAGNTYYFAIRSVSQDNSVKSLFSNEVITTISLSDTSDPTESNSSNLVAAYGFDEVDDTAVMDLSGNYNDGIISGAAHTNTGVFGRAISFDGVDDSIDLNNLDVSGGDGLTISLWMYAHDFGTLDGRLVSKATGVNEQDHYWMLSTFRNNSVRFRLKTGGTTKTLISDTGVIAAGQWHHVAATYDRQYMRLYVDGVEVGSISKSDDIDTNDNVPAAIGNQPQGGKPFHGLIDEVRIYNSPLTVEEILTDSNEGITDTMSLEASNPTNSFLSQLVVAYDFEGVDDIAVTDLSGNYNDGIISGAARTNSGAFGRAISFDGVDDSIDLNYLDVFGGDDLTISVWMYADDFGTSDGRLVSKATGVNEQDHYWMLSTFRNNSVRFRLKTGGTTKTLISDSGVIAAGQWHHVAATYDRQYMRLYVDGVEVGSISKSGDIDTNGNVPAAVGNQPQGGKPFDGLIDEVRLYSSALTVEQIQTDMTIQIQ